MSATPPITMQPVTSSQIAAIGHSPELNLLAIQFPPKKSGVADTYHYQGVDAAMFAEFLAAESQGSFFIQRIKKFPDLYPFTKLDPAALALAPVAAPLIDPVPVVRDAEGWWSHPGIPDFDEGQEAEYAAWIKKQGLVTAYKSLEGEDLTHPAYIAYFDDETASVAGWNPIPPAGEGWFTVSIHDSEEGPYWVWARRVDVAADHTLALAINAKCYGEPLPGGQRYSRTTFKDTGYPILLDADGKRSVFCDLCDDMENAA